ncbi:MAG: hypothetical protein JXR39_13330 [Marinilabiliaceae bacterium]|nr:hypothetical protein [Marinilabiliaceae bacterium]
MKRFILMFGLLCLCLYHADAQQVYQFSAKYDEFLVQLKDRFELTSEKKEVKTYMDAFLQFWSSPELPDAARDQIIATLNLLNVKKAQPYPDYDTYLSTYRVFVETKHDAQSFNAWHQAVSDMIKKPRVALRTVNRLMDVARNQLQKGIIYATPSVSWSATPAFFSYQYDGEQLKAVYPGPFEMTCKAFNDSITIFNTSGSFALNDLVWKADKGSLTWERAGFAASDVYATLDTFQIKLEKPYFEASNVVFYNRQFFSFPLKGSIEHKVAGIKTPEDAVYPKFRSSGERFRIDNIHPNMVYEGGFSQHGAKFLGSGTDGEPARINIVRNDTVFVEARSRFFALRKDYITSTDAEVYIRLDSAFIYHPGLLFKFVMNDNELHLIRNGEGLAQSPYFDTYHNISLDVELIRWQLHTNTINFQMVSGAAQNYAFFESLSYYRENFYNQLQGMDAIHPLQGLKNCSRYFHGHPFTAADYAKFLGMPQHQVRQQVMNLSFFGFIGYNVDTDMIEIRDRLEDYLQFRLGKKDYDVIRFNSTTEARVPNAQLDLQNYDLRLNGVSNISICDHQNVVFFPREEKILLKQNRNFSFDGSINAGMLNFFGDGFKFSYDNFRIDMEVIDSMRMQVQTGDLDYFGQPQLAFVRSTIADLSGYLQIDKPNNKSGREKNPQFPILKSDKTSKVYYEKPEIYDNAYKREHFYFALDTFTLTNVNTLNRQNINFAGQFTSGIFPEFREMLTVRNDYSLGFKRKTPDDGFPAYGGKANYYQDIDLSNKGLHGNGKLTYLTSTAYSEDFLFLPDQVLAQVHQFTMEKQAAGVQFPDVSAKYVDMDFHPYSDDMSVKSLEENFTMYNSEAQLKGSIQVKPTGLEGKGTFYMLHGSLVSPAYQFGHHTVLADSSDFNLSTGGVEGVAFNTTNLISNIDFETRMGTFTAKNAGNKVDFTENRYISYIDRFSWDMDRNYIYLGEKGSKGNRFVSTHRRQDSLDFYAPLARYDVGLKMIEAEEVKNIHVADVNVFLKNGIVRIRPDAVMDPLDSTTIELNNGLHKMYNANVTIEGKKSYKGRGWYDFVNGNGKVLPIRFDQIKVDDDVHTTASGVITPSNFFTFDKHFAYKGKVALNALDTLLSFNGGVQLLHPCPSGPQAYLQFEGLVDPKKIMIPVGDKLMDADRNDIFADFFLTKDSVHLYSSFLESQKDYSDMSVLKGVGFLRYNASNASFDIAPKHRHERADTTGTILQFLESGCNVYGEGRLNMAIDLDQVMHRAAGTVLHQRDKNQITVSSCYGIDFFFNEEVVEAIKSMFLNSKAKNSSLSAETFEKRMAEIIGRPAAKALQAERASVGESKSLPDSVAGIFSFANVDWTWRTASSSYVANGVADLTLIRKQMLNRQVTVKAELMRKRSGNSIDLYVAADDEKWVYFSYKAGIMQVLTSDQDLNLKIQTIKSEERKMKTRMGEKQFSYILAPNSKVARFLQRIENLNNAPEDEDVMDAVDEEAVPVE